MKLTIPHCLIGFGAVCAAHDYTSAATQAVVVACLAGIVNWYMSYPWHETKNR